MSKQRPKKTDQPMTVSVRFDPSDLDKIERVRERMIAESAMGLNITKSDAIRWMVKEFKET